MQLTIFINCIIIAKLLKKIIDILLLNIIILIKKLFYRISEIGIYWY